jgi:hypothetical protein
LVSALITVAGLGLIGTLLWVSNQDPAPVDVRSTDLSSQSQLSITSYEPAEATTLTPTDQIRPQEIGDLARKDAGVIEGSRRQASLTDIVEVLGDPDNVMRPKSSVELGGKYRGGLGRVSVSNGTGRDALAVLNEDNGQPRRAIYVRAGEDGLITSIPQGAYRLRFQFGDSWLKSAGHFCEPSGTSEFTETFTFAEVETGSGTEFDTFRVTLHTLPSGDAHTERLPDIPLPLPPP